MMDKGLYSISNSNQICYCFSAEVKFCWEGIMDAHEVEESVFAATDAKVFKAIYSYKL